MIGLGSKTYNEGDRTFYDAINNSALTDGELSRIRIGAMCNFKCSRKVHPAINEAQEKDI